MRLTTLQNKAVRIIAHARWRASCDPIHKYLNIMKLAHINTYLIGRFMFRISIGKIPESPTSLLKNPVIINHTVLELPTFIMSPVWN